MDDEAPKPAEPLIAAITVEVAKLELDPGDILMLTPKTDAARDMLEQVGVDWLRQRLRVTVLIGHTDVDVTIVKRPSDPPPVS